MVDACGCGNEPSGSIKCWVRCGGMDWIELAQARDMWWTLVGAVMNLRVP